LTSSGQLALEFPGDVHHVAQLEGFRSAMKARDLPAALDAFAPDGYCQRPRQPCAR
jgi:hypothetical protein